jgi:hypothetical protein
MRNYSLCQSTLITMVDLTSSRDTNGCTYPLRPVAMWVLVGLLLGNVVQVLITLVLRRSCQVAISMPVGVNSWLLVATGVILGVFFCQWWTAFL